MNAYTAPTVIHIFGRTPHHYLPMKAFFESLANQFSGEQQFWAWQSDASGPYPDVLSYENSADLVTLMAQQHTQSVFLFHGFFDRSLWPKLLLSRFPARSSWVCWGADLYEHFEPGLGIKRKGMYWIHRLLTARFKRVFSLNQGDGEIIRKRLWPVDVTTLPYPLIGSTTTAKTRDPSQPVVILVGNSANPTNHHIDVFDQLRHLADQPVRLVVPLNYAGSQAYVKDVVSVGRDYFGDKFEPVVDMLSKTQYDELLASADVVVFAHRRQQGLYVVYSMLKHGKKIFIRKDISTYSTLTNSGFTVFDLDSISGASLQQLTEIAPDQAEQNKRLMQETFSEQALAPKWCQALRALIGH